MNAIGVTLKSLECEPLRAFALARSLGFDVVHANAVPEAWLEGSARHAYLQAARNGGVAIATQFIGFDGQDYSTLRTIATTVGLVRADMRSHRIAVAHKYSDLAADMGVRSLTMHVGFLPRDPIHPDYVGVVDAVRGLLDLCAERGQMINLETGQESADELLGFIQRVGRANLGVNFDPANFLLYDTDEPLAALELLHPLLNGVHCKDGLRPQVSGDLGEETPLGEGAVTWPVMLARLLELGCHGPLVIERERRDGNAVNGIHTARNYLRYLLNS
jgi:sugar phosphate isomerase/epimerase